jgi:hypothetical protein
MSAVKQPQYQAEQDKFETEEVAMSERTIISFHPASPGWRVLVGFRNHKGGDEDILPVTKWVITEASGHRMAEPAITVGRYKDVLLRDLLSYLNAESIECHELLPPGVPITHDDYERVARLAREAYDAREQRRFDALLKAARSTGMVQ